MVRPDRTAGAGRVCEIHANHLDTTPARRESSWLRLLHADALLLLLLVLVFGNLLKPVISDTLLAFITPLPPHHPLPPIILLLCCCRGRDPDADDENLRLSLIIFSDCRYSRSDGCTSLHLWWNPPVPGETMIRCSNLVRSKHVLSSVNKSPSFRGRSKHPTATDSLFFLKPALSSDLLNDVGS